MAYDGLEGGVLCSPTGKSDDTGKEWWAHGFLFDYLPLADLRISGSVLRSPKLISKEGCGYCVRIPERRLTDALMVLRREGIAPKQVFLQTADGEYSEVKA